MPSRAAAGPLGCLAAVVVGGLLAGCSGGSTPAADPRQLLRQAKQALDGTQAAHFALSSRDAQRSGAAVVTAGDGDVARPDGFRGTMTVQGGALSGRLAVVSVGGTFYLQLPLVGTWTTVDPHSYGFGDPGTLLDPRTGISTFLTEAQNPQTRGQVRVGGEVADVVHATVPGRTVGRVLTTADPAKPVDATFDIVPGSHQVRQVTLTGPFFSRARDSTFTVTLTRYGEHVSISAPK